MMPYRRFQRRRRGKEALQAAQSGTMAETSVSKPLIVFCAGTPWSGIAGSDRHLAIALTRHARVLWVDPPLSVLTPSPRRMDVGRLPWPRLCPVFRG